MPARSPSFPAETRAIRDADWTVAPLPKDLLDRRVEITGPVDRKMVINALNCGANRSTWRISRTPSTPTWENLIEGHVNLIDAVRRTIAFDDPQTGRHYKLQPKTATLLVRPRGWHLPEAHVLVDGAPMSGSLFDFGLYFFHNAKELVKRGTGPYFYLPKLESRHEAKLWNDVFVESQKRLGIAEGHDQGDRADRDDPGRVRDGRDPLRAARSFVRAQLRPLGLYLQLHQEIRRGRILRHARPGAGDDDVALPALATASLLIKTCHRRNVHAMGGMAAQIPIRDNPAANEAAMEKVRADKLREAGDGHDGTWVAHPGLVPIAKEIFDKAMPEANQIARKRQDVNVSAADLLRGARGHHHRGGIAPERQCRHRLSRGVAAGARAACRSIT